jgi:hypothetical protein
MQRGLFYQLNQIINFEGHPENRHVDLIRGLGKAAPGEAENLIRRHLRSGKEHLMDMKF